MSKSRKKKDWSDPSTISGQLQRLGFANYREYLNSPHWISLRREYAEREDLPQRCACGAVYESLHHASYEFLGEEDPADLIPVCDRCHRRVHRKRRRRHRPPRQPKLKPKPSPLPALRGDTALEAFARRVETG